MALGCVRLLIEKRHLATVGEPRQNRRYRDRLMTIHFVLLPSPLLGAAVWEPVAAVLRGFGHVVTTATLRGPVRAPVEVLEGFLAAFPDGPVVLVPHSNAGLFVPALAARHRVLATVFVDAALPPTKARTTTAAPAAFYDFLAAKADVTGVLPVWTEWWGEEEVNALFPDLATRQRVEMQQQRLPLAYFTEPLPVREGWDAEACAYLAFGDTYAEEVQGARERRWPVATAPGGHLEMLWQPNRVAHQVERLAHEVLGTNDR